MHGGGEGELCGGRQASRLQPRHALTAKLTLSHTLALSLRVCLCGVRMVPCPKSTPPKAEEEATIDHPLSAVKTLASRTKAGLHRAHRRPHYIQPALPRACSCKGQAHRHKRVAAPHCGVRLGAQVERILSRVASKRWLSGPVPVDREDACKQGQAGPGDAPRASWPWRGHVCKGLALALAQARQTTSPPPTIQLLPRRHDHSTTPCLPPSLFTPHSLITHHSSSSHLPSPSPQTDRRRRLVA